MCFLTAAELLAVTAREQLVLIPETKDRNQGAKHETDSQLLTKGSFQTSGERLKLEEEEGMRAGDPIALSPPTRLHLEPCPELLLCLRRCFPGVRSAVLDGHVSGWWRNRLLMLFMVL